VIELLDPMRALGKTLSYRRVMTSETPTYRLCILSGLFEVSKVPILVSPGYGSHGFDFPELCILEYELDREQ
jgi:hypothetical protein